MRAQIRGVGAVGAERFDVDGQVLEVLQPRSSRHDFSQPEAEELELRHVRMVRPEPVPADEMDHSSPGWARVGKLGQAQPVNLLECLLWPVLRRRMPIAMAAPQAAHGDEPSTTGGSVEQP